MNSYMDALSIQEKEREAVLARLIADIEAKAYSPVVHFGDDYEWFLEMRGNILDMLQRWPNHAPVMKLKLARSLFRGGLHQVSTRVGDEDINEELAKTHPLLSLESVPLPITERGFWEEGCGYSEAEYYLLRDRYWLWGGRRIRLCVLIWLYNLLTGSGNLSITGINIESIDCDKHTLIELPALWAQHIGMISMTRDADYDIANECIAEKKLQQSQNTTQKNSEEEQIGSASLSSDWMEWFENIASRTPYLKAQKWVEGVEAGHVAGIVEVLYREHLLPGLRTTAINALLAEFGKPRTGKTRYKTSRNKKKKLPKSFTDGAAAAEQALIQAGKLPATAGNTRKYPRSGEWYTSERETDD